GWPAITRQPFPNAQTVSSSFVNADTLTSLNEAQERGDRVPLPPCSDRACHDARSAALLNATRTPVLPRLTRILPPFCALCSASHFMISGSSLVLPSNSRTPTISSSLRRFTIMHAFLKFLGGASPAATGQSGSRVASHGDLPSITPRLDVGFSALRPKAPSPLSAVTAGAASDLIPRAALVLMRSGEPPAP